MSCDVIWHHIALGSIVVWKLASNCANSTGRLEASSRDLSAYESLAWSFFNTEAAFGVLLSYFVEQLKVGDLGDEDQASSCVCRYLPSLDVQ